MSLTPKETNPSKCSPIPGSSLKVRTGTLPEYDLVIDCPAFLKNPSGQIFCRNTKKACIPNIKD